MPGAALAGRQELMSELQVTRSGGQHQGTWNGAPTSCAAGLACMELLEDTTVYQRLDDASSRFRAQLNQVFDEVGVAGSVYGEGSLLHVALRHPRNGAMSPIEVHASRLDVVSNVFLRCALLVEGIDWFTSHASSLSLAHSEEDLVQTVMAFRRALRRYREAFDA
jgi:glutamate-1-semialdehyde aminotransferase